MLTTFPINLRDFESTGGENKANYKATNMAKTEATGKAKAKAKNQRRPRC